ncbi:MAG TPA: RNA-binding protein [Candidatus Paceibacterota bacterium]|nr:RNA-binding protein [Candidatus Paceibacterota bacterium]
MGKRLYVGGISYNTSEAGLTEAFAQAGTVVSATILPDRKMGRPHAGFGFVEMSTPEEAQAAIDMWNNKELDGRRLTVNEARPMEERPRNGGGGYRGNNDRGGYNGNRASNTRSWQ